MSAKQTLEWNLQNMMRGKLIWPNIVQITLPQNSYLSSRLSGDLQEKVLKIHIATLAMRRNMRTSRPGFFLRSFLVLLQRRRPSMIRGVWISTCITQKIIENLEWNSSFYQKVIVRCNFYGIECYFKIQVPNFRRYQNLIKLLFVCVLI